MDGTVSVEAYPVFSVVSAETDRLLFEAETLDGLLLGAATLEDEGEDLGGVIVLRGGTYDAATTALVQEKMV